MIVGDLHYWTCSSEEEHDHGTCSGVLALLEMRCGEMYYDGDNIVLCQQPFVILQIVNEEDRGDIIEILTSDGNKGWLALPPHYFTDIKLLK